MEKKYYLPSIEEFFVGFEWEYHNAFVKDYGKWTKETVEYNYSSYHIANLIVTGAVRIKYLDSEDIESCGFKIIKIQNNAFQGRINFKYDIKATGESYEDVEGYWDIIVSGDKYCTIHKECMGLTTFFRGIIKNKSELRKILTMVGVYEVTRTE